ncbi:hypothetical protein Pmar_PMAR012764, partial [Perkinsus marinus ATCC 50983]
MSDPDEVYDTTGPRGGADGDDNDDSSSGGKWRAFADIGPSLTDHSDASKDRPWAEARVRVGHQDREGSVSAADALDQELGELLNEISEPVGHGPPTVATCNTALPNLALQRVEPECSFEDMADMAEAVALYVQQLTRRSMAGIVGGEVGVLEESESEDVQSYSSSSSLSSESVAIDDDTSSQLEGSDGPGDAVIEVSNGASGASALPPLPSMPPPARPKSQ